MAKQRPTVSCDTGIMRPENVQRLGDWGLH